MAFTNPDFLKELRKIIWGNRMPLFIGQILADVIEGMNELAVAM